MMYTHPVPHFPAMPYVHGVMPGMVHPRKMNDEKDLASVSLQIQKKRFYVDVKKNRRGRFMKIAEVSADGSKSRILLTMPAAAEVKEKLKDLLEVLAETEEKLKAESANGDGEKNGGTTSDGLIKSHIINHPNRRYYLDLKKNRRGLFLRLAMLSTYVRVQLAVPSQGISQLLSVITELLDEWWDKSASDENRGLNLPPSRSLRVDNKTFYFDSLASHHRIGAILRISEVKSDSRTAITIPARSLARFKNVLNELSDNLSTIDLKKETAEAKTENGTSKPVENGVASDEEK